MDILGYFKGRRGRLRSFKSITIAFEIATLMVLLVVLFLLSSLLQNNLKVKIEEQLVATAGIIDHSIEFFINDRKAEFLELSKKENLDAQSNVLPMFSDLYFLDEHLSLTRLIKASDNSRIFKGYKIISGDLFDFISQYKGHEVLVSPMIRSPEIDSVGIYLIKRVGKDYLVARIDISQFNVLLNRMEAALRSMILIASKEGYIMTASNPNLPFVLVPSENQISSEYLEEHFITKIQSQTFKNDIILVTPYSNVNMPLNIVNFFTPILALIIIFMFSIKIFFQNQWFVKPILELIRDLKRYSPQEENRVLGFKKLLYVKEIHSLYETFVDKTKEIEMSFQNITQSKNKALEQIVESEKLSSLGSMVAGVTHEINTPIGVSVTSASFMEEQNKALKASLEKNELTKAMLTKHLDNESESLRIILISLARVSELIMNFKKLAVEQTSGVESTFSINALLETVIKSLRYEYKKKNIDFKVLSERDYLIKSTPGLFYQIFTNLIMNSINHGFNAMDTGLISIEIKRDSDNTLIIDYTDTGCGIEEDIQEKIFEPFFTTNRNKGGSGLGLHIIYNLVVNQLEGSINLDSTYKNGARFILKLENVLIETK